MYKSWLMPNGDLVDMVLMELKNDRTIGRK